MEAIEVLIREAVAKHRVLKAHAHFDSWRLGKQILQMVTIALTLEQFPEITSQAHTTVQPSKGIYLSAVLLQVTKI